MAKDQTVLFHDTVFGPIHSRRLGLSLGINLMPNDGKVCSYDCLYCEAGYNRQGIGTTGLPEARQVARQLEDKLRQMAEEDQLPDVITFSGNGEPTMHPQFEEIVKSTIALRDQYAPKCKVAVLSNATRLHERWVARALGMVDENILKLDSAVRDTHNRLNRPVSKRDNPTRLVEHMKQFRNVCIVQTMMLRGTHFNKRIDNTTDAEVEALIEAYRQISPRRIQLYSIDRETPDAAKETLLVLDATTGQNGLQQAKVFRETAGLTGIILTKLDGTAKGGICVAIAQELGVPVKYVGLGEGIDDLQPFDAKEYVNALI